MKTFLMDIIDIIISSLNLNKKNIYKEFVLQCSLSQLIRGKNHNKKNLLNFLKRLAKYLFLFIRIICFNFSFTFVSTLKVKQDKEKFNLIIIFPDKDSWILRGLSKDLEREINKLNIKAKACEISKIFDYEAKHILFIHHNLALRIINKYPQYSRISSTYLSHIRNLKLSEIETLNKLNYIFCQSDKDKMRLNSFGFLPGKVISFPLGYDNSLFYSYKNFQQRKYDFVISTPLKLKSLGSHYWLRKSSILLHDLIAKLSSENYKILIMGENWDLSLLKANNKIHIVNPIYKEKPALLNDCKFFLNLSLIEGGPVTLLEALACGCMSISKDNGFSNQVSIDIPEKSFNIKNITSSDEISSEIIKIFESKKEEFNNNFSKILEKNYSFKYLSKKIVKSLNL